MFDYQFSKSKYNFNIALGKFTLQGDIHCFITTHLLKHSLRLSYWPKKLPLNFRDFNWKFFDSYTKKHFVFETFIM